jgi:hypothetical protein
LFIAYNYGDDALVGKYNIDGTVIDPRLILAGGIGGIAVDSSATIPETLSTLWLGLAVVGLLGFERFLRLPNWLPPEHC